jgi:uncharacterized protein YbaP (TraB family)
MKNLLARKRPSSIPSLTIRIFLALFMLLVLITIAGAQDGSKSFLWKVRSESATAYILGSVHILKEDIYPLKKSIEDAFEKSDALAVEVNINEADAGNMQEMILAKALYPQGDSLKKHLSGETYELAESKLKELGMTLEVFESVRPWSLALTITTLELGKLGFDPAFGIDSHFLMEAEGRKKIIELESADSQISLLSNFSEKEQENFLFYTLKDLDVLEKELSEMLQAWKTGDAKTLDSLLSETAEKYPEIQPVYEKLIYARNRTMADRIEKLLKTKETYFIVVGAGHLVGRKGIIEILKNKGYAIEQL